ncbi:xanthine dehydrogenase family protein molybdopterin-binding subunit [Nitrobacter sp.]|uniref:xanthine dehydrogenase family protein molybdopterin-binding subunit n=1 Tax=Nitrobacter sp. TaxID=29420 RepID=UPI003F653D1D
MTSYIGKATSRVDGRDKVTGAARYAAEFGAPDLAYASLVTSPIARGRLKQLDVTAALKVQGVITVLSHQNRPLMADNDKAYKDQVAPRNGSPFRPLYDDHIKFSGQPLAMVLAEDPETASYAASLVHVVYDEEPHVTDITRQRNNAVALKAPAKPRGDATRAFSESDVRHEADYFVPIEHHNPMELYASTAIWNDGRITVYDKTQGVQNVHGYLCGVFECDPGDIRVMSPYVGGAFGSGLRPPFQVALAVLAARAISRSVRLVLTRQQMYAIGYRPAMIQRIQLGAKADGSLNAISHDAVTSTSQYEDFHRNETTWSGLLYKSETARYDHKLARLDLPTGCDMRAPSAATGVYALEAAMDELAEALKMDPIELRLKCYSDRDQSSGLPFSSKNLRECYRQGAEAFGWSRRNPAPRSMRHGRELIGWGMATGVWEALQMPITVRIALTSNGHAEVSCATADIGTGTYTIMAQVAADMLGLPLEAISIKLGDSALPQAPVEGGSWMAASVSNGIVTTCKAIRDDLLKLAQRLPGSPLKGRHGGDVVLADGAIALKTDSRDTVAIADVMRSAGIDRIEREEQTTFAKDDAHAHNTHSAIFAEVRVDEEIGVIRVTRVVSAVAAGRILNLKTARSQIMGGVVWGMGMALHEETLIDHRFGRVMNANIAEYHVPVNADVHDIDVIFVDEQDELVNPMGVKGLGEIGIVGVPAAIANAVHHATGVRVRDLPITLDKLTRKA